MLSLQNPTLNFSSTDVSTSVDMTRIFIFSVFHPFHRSYLYVSFRFHPFHRYYLCFLSIRAFSDFHPFYRWLFIFLFQQILQLNQLVAQLGSLDKLHLFRRQIGRASYRERV